MTPEGPPGTVTVSVAPGTSGPVAWYSSNDGDSTAQLPATGGLSVGRGLLGARSVENCTVMVEPAATLVPVGEIEETVSAGGGAGRGGRGLIAVHAVDGHEATGRDGQHRHADADDDPSPCAAFGSNMFASHDQRDSTRENPGLEPQFSRNFQRDL